MTSRIVLRAAGRRRPGTLHETRRRIATSVPPVAALLLAAVLLAGCATQQGGVPGDLSRAAQQAGSAAASGSLSLSAFVDGRGTRALTATALQDMLNEVADAQDAVDSLSVGTSDEHALREEARGAIGRASDALVEARALVDGAISPPGGRLVAALDAVAEDLDALAGRLEGAP